jgi:hypothetical protein
LTGPPVRVTAVPRLHRDLEVLAALTKDVSPPWVRVRAAQTITIRYGFVDASGPGFRSSILRPGGLGVQIGLWGKDGIDKSSNFRELRNGVDAVVDEVEKQGLFNAEAFIFTDNSTTENCWWKGTSTSPALLEQVVRLKQLEMRAGLKVWFIHCAGTRMIAQGTDGFSRGDLTEGVATAADFLSFVPLHLNAFEQSPGLKDWLSLAFEAKSGDFLTPEDWFGGKGHDVVG